MYNIIGRYCKSNCEVKLLDIKNINIWKSPCENVQEVESTKIESTRLSQFEEKGYRIKKYDVNYIIVERLKSTRSVICESIDDAEIIINLAIALENNINYDMTPSPRRYIVDKAEILVGR
jgi:hypothetical protein